MNSSQPNELVDNSDDFLIDWHSPKIVDNNDNKTNVQDLLNNPFDVMEFRAENMDPFELGFNQTLLKNDPPCSNFFSPLREPNNRQIQKGLSLPDLHNVGGIFVENYKEFVMKGQPEVVDVKTNDIIDLSNENFLLANLSGNKVTKSLEHKIEPVLGQDLNEVNIEQISKCNEEEKRQIREETRQRIEKLIKQEKHVYKEKCSRWSLSTSTPQRDMSIASLDVRGFNENDSFKNFESYDYLASNVSVCENNNISNISPIFCARDLTSFDLNLLEPKWVVDNFSDDDASSIDIKSKDKSSTVGFDQIDVTPKAVSCIEGNESKTNGNKKSMLTKRIPKKSPFRANIPLQHMVQNYKEIDYKPINRQSIKKAKPVVTSASKLNTCTATKTPLATRSNSFPRQSISSLIKSPKTPVNNMKITKKSSNNVLVDLHENTLVQPVLHSASSKNSSTNMFNIATEKKNEIQNSLQVNKSNFQSKIARISIPVASNKKKVTGLPVSKRSMMFKGKENVL